MRRGRNIRARYFILNALVDFLLPGGARLLGIEGMALSYLAQGSHLLLEQSRVGLEIDAVGRIEIVRYINAGQLVGGNLEEPGQGMRGERLVPGVDRCIRMAKGLCLALASAPASNQVRPLTGHFKPFRRRIGQAEKKQFLAGD